MCRYGFNSYKPHYACFKCRKTFKRKLLIDIDGNTAYTKVGENQQYKCPECGRMTADMGFDFESPKKSDLRAWNHIQDLYETGITFHSCGCSGPGYIPKTKEKLVEYLENIKQEYHSNLDFWRQRNEPTNEREIQSEQSKNWEYLNALPNEIRQKKGAVETEDAKNYWFDKIKEVEHKLDKLK